MNGLGQPEVSDFDHRMCGGVYTIEKNVLRFEIPMSGIHGMNILELKRSMFSAHRVNGVRWDILPLRCTTDI